MIQLPSNLTVAGLALLLGLLIGAGGGYLLFHDSSTPVEIVQGEGNQVVERDRPIAEKDTSGQEEPDVEVRYDTVRATDTLTVPVPSSLPLEPIMSDRTPLDITEDAVTHSYYDPRERRWEQRVYRVPADRFGLSFYGTAVARSPLREPQLRLGRTFLGVGVEVRYRTVEAALETQTTPTLTKQQIELTLRYDLARL